MLTFNPTANRRKYITPLAPQRADTVKCSDMSITHRGSVVHPMYPYLFRSQHHASCSDDERQRDFTLMPDFGSIAGAPRSSHMDRIDALRAQQNARREHLRGERLSYTPEMERVARIHALRANRNKTHNKLGKTENSMSGRGARRDNALQTLFVTGGPIFKRRNRNCDRKPTPQSSIHYGFPTSTHNGYTSTEHHDTIEPNFDAMCVNV